MLVLLVTLLLLILLLMLHLLEMLLLLLLLLLLVLLHGDRLAGVLLWHMLASARLHGMGWHGLGLGVMR